MKVYEVVSEYVKEQVLLVAVGEHEDEQHANQVAEACFERWDGVLRSSARELSLAEIEGRPGKTLVLVGGEEVALSRFLTSDIGEPLRAKLYREAVEAAGQLRLLAQEAGS